MAMSSEAFHRERNRRIDEPPSLFTALDDASDLLVTAKRVRSNEIIYRGYCEGLERPPFDTDTTSEPSPVALVSWRECSKSSTSKSQAVVGTLVTLSSDAEKDILSISLDSVAKGSGLASRRTAAGTAMGKVRSGGPKPINNLKNNSFHAPVIPRGVKNVHSFDYDSDAAEQFRSPKRLRPSVFLESRQDDEGRLLDDPISGRRSSTSNSQQSEGHLSRKSLQSMNQDDNKTVISLGAGVHEFRVAESHLKAPKDKRFRAVMDEQMPKSIQHVGSGPEMECSSQTPNGPDALNDDIEKSSPDHPKRQRQMRGRLLNRSNSAQFASSDHRGSSIDPLQAIGDWGTMTSKSTKSMKTNKSISKLIHKLGERMDIYHHSIDNNNANSEDELASCTMADECSMAIGGVTSTTLPKKTSMTTDKRRSQSQIVMSSSKHIFAVASIFSGAYEKQAEPPNTTCGTLAFGESSGILVIVPTEGSTDELITDGHYPLNLQLQSLRSLTWCPVGAKAILHRSQGCSHDFNLKDTSKMYVAFVDNETLRRFNQQVSKFTVKDANVVDLNRMNKMYAKAYSELSPLIQKKDGRPILEANEESDEVSQRKQVPPSNLKRSAKLVSEMSAQEQASSTLKTTLGSELPAAPSVRKPPALSFRRATRNSGLGKLCPSPSPSPGASVFQAPWSSEHPEYRTSWPTPLYWPLDAKKKVTVDVEDIARLDADEYLNDNLVQFYIRYLEVHLEKESPEIAKRVLFMNSFFYQKLTANPPKGSTIDYDSIQRWTRGFNAFKYDYIVIPVCERAHWYVVIIIKPGNLVRRKNSKAPEIEATGIPGDSAVESSMHGSEPRTLLDIFDAGRSPKRSSMSPVDSQMEELRLLDITPTHIETTVDTSSPQATISTHADVATVSQEEGAFAHSTTSRKRLFPKDEQRKSGFRAAGYKPGKTKILVLDPLNVAHSATSKNLQAWLVAEAMAQYGIEVESDTKPGANGRRIPRQPNAFDCGIYLLGYIEQFLDDPDAFVELVLASGGFPDIFDINSDHARSALRMLLLNLRDSQVKHDFDAKNLRAVRKGKPELSMELWEREAVSNASRACGKTRITERVADTWVRPATRNVRESDNTGYAVAHQAVRAMDSPLKSDGPFARSPPQGGGPQKPIRIMDDTNAQSSPRNTLTSELAESQVMATSRSPRLLLEHQLDGAQDPSMLMSSSSDDDSEPQSSYEKSHELHTYQKASGQRGTFSSVFRGFAKPSSRSENPPKAEEEGSSSDGDQLIATKISRLSPDDGRRRKSATKEAHIGSGSPHSRYTASPSRRRREPAIVSID